MANFIDNRNRPGFGINAFNDMGSPNDSSNLNNRNDLNTDNNVNTVGATNYVSNARPFSGGAGGSGNEPNKASTTTYLRQESELERLQRRTRQLDEQSIAMRMVLEGIAEAMSADGTLSLLLRRITQVAVRLTAAHVGALYLMDQESGLQVETVETASSAAISNIFDPIENAYTPQNTPPGNAPATVGMQLMAGQGIVGTVAQSGEPALVLTPATDDRFAPGAVNTDATVLGLRPGSLLVAPIRFRGDVMGVLEVAKAQGAELFDMYNLDLIQALAAQAAVAIANTRLYQRLLGEHDRIIKTLEDERIRINRELHDGPTQGLAQIAMTLGVAEQLAISEQGRPQLAIAEMRKAKQLAKLASSDIRALLSDLRPLALEAEHGGLVTAIRQFIERFESADDLQMRLQAEYPTRLPHAVELTVFSIVREAVNNVRKHAQARNCVIGIRENAERLLVTIQDDGVGFDKQRIQAEYPTRGSWGLLNMLERAGLINGELHINTKPGKGTLVTLDVPLI